MPISVFLIVKNEERCIERALLSIIKSASDIVIVDTGSTDNTIKLITALNSKKIQLFQINWTDCFSTAKNFALSKAKYDWCLALDADEYLPKGELAKLINKVSKWDQDNHSDQLLISPRIENIGDGLLTNNPRIFKRTIDTRYFGRVHEYLYKPEVKYVSVNIRISHDGYLKGIYKSKNKSERNFLLLSAQINEDPNNIRWAYFMLRYLNSKSLKHVELLVKFGVSPLPFPNDQEIYYLQISYLYIFHLICTGSYDHAQVRIKEVSQIYQDRELHKLDICCRYLKNIKNINHVASELIGKILLLKNSPFDPYAPKSISNHTISHINSKLNFELTK